MGGPAGNNHLHSHFCQKWKDTEDFTTCELLLKPLICISSLKPENVCLYFSLSLPSPRFSLSISCPSFLPCSFSLSSLFPLSCLSLPPPRKNTVIRPSDGGSTRCLPLPFASPTTGNSFAMALRTSCKENLSKQLQFFSREQGGIKGWSSPCHTHVNNYHPISC